MLCRIAFYQEVYALKSSQIGIRLRKCKVKTISKGTHTAIYVFYDVMCQVHITSFSCKYTPRFRQYQIFGGFSLRNRKKLRGKTKISLDICSFGVFSFPLPSQSNSFCHLPRYSIVLLRLLHLKIGNAVRSLLLFVSSVGICSLRRIFLGVMAVHQFLCIID